MLLNKAAFAGCVPYNMDRLIFHERRLATG